MAKTKKKRRRKHRGTQGGGVARAPKGRPRNRAEARARAKSQRGSREPKGLKPPSWGSAIGKGALASLLFFALFAGVFGRPIGASAGFSAFMLGFYVPLSYYLDGFFYRRRMRQLEQKRQEAG